MSRFIGLICLLMLGCHPAPPSPTPKQVEGGESIEGDIGLREVLAFDVDIDDDEGALSLDNSGRSFSTLPPELQFSCARVLDWEEEAWQQKLIAGDINSRVVAATVLWTRQSRAYSRDVLQSLTDLPPDSANSQALRKAVDVSLSAAVIAQDLKSGDYEWAVWRAYLRPHPDLVPLLIAALDKQPTSPRSAIVALGASRSRAALEPLLRYLRGDDEINAGFAAVALGELGFVDAEPDLIKAIDSSSPWQQACVCTALGKLGTERTLKRLTILAASQKPRGAINVAAQAQQAIEKINARAGK